jgi:hypothetical protein
VISTEGDRRHTRTVIAANERNAEQHRQRLLPELRCGS